MTANVRDVLGSANLHPPGLAAGPADRGEHRFDQVGHVVGDDLEHRTARRVRLGGAHADQLLPGGPVPRELAVGAGGGLGRADPEQALLRLPRQLAFAFRGVLSFWTAGELPDAALAPNAREIAKALLCGFSERS